MIKSNTRIVQRYHTINIMKTYKIYDTITKEFGDRVYKNIKVVRNIIDKKNNEYGSYRYLLRLNH